MEIWITTDENGFLTSYSSVEQPELVKVIIDKEPTDFTNWRLDGDKLIHDTYNAPIIKSYPSDIDALKQQNALMVKQVASLTMEVFKLKNGGVPNE